MNVENPDFFPMEREGKIKVMLGRITSFHTNKLALEVQKTSRSKNDQEKTEIDNVQVCVLATGFDLSLDFLSADIKSHLFNEYGQLQLFRNVYNPDLAQMAFVGFHFIANQMLVPAIASRWIVELAKGEEGALWRRGVLADTSAMTKSIQAGLAYERQFFPSNPHVAKGLFTTGFGIHAYIDCILAELGSKRFHQRYLASITEPLYPVQYKGYMDEPLA